MDIGTCEGSRNNFGTATTVNFQVCRSAPNPSRAHSTSRFISSPGKTWRMSRLSQESELLHWRLRKWLRWFFKTRPGPMPLSTRKSIEVSPPSHPSPDWILKKCASPPFCLLRVMSNRAPASETLLDGAARGSVPRANWLRT